MSAPSTNDSLAGKAPWLSIAIVGAGPAGLTLARILAINGILSTVYEAEESPTVRSQGGTLDLHQQTGMLALRAAGLEGVLHRHLRPEGEEMRILDKNNQVLFEYKPERSSCDEGSPEVDRGHLREVLLGSLEPGVVAWGRKLVSVEQVENTSQHLPLYKLKFTSGHESHANLIVGADGAWSRVRRIIAPDVRPTYSGLSVLDYAVRPSAERAEELRLPGSDKIVGHGLGMVLSDRRALMLQRNSGGVVRIYTGALVPETPRIDDTIERLFAREPLTLALSTPQTKQLLLDHLYIDWDARLRAFIEEAADDEPIIPRPIHIILPGTRWPTRPGAEVVGDAAHVMSFFAGQGANTAMADSMDLALALVDEVHKLKEDEGAESVSPSDRQCFTALIAAQKKYAALMFARAERATTQSHRSLINCFSAQPTPIIAARFYQQFQEARGKSADADAYSQQSEVYIAPCVAALLPRKSVQKAGEVASAKSTASLPA